MAIDIVFYEYRFHKTELLNYDFGIIGFGGISKKSLNYESDLDLVYVFNNKNNKNYNPNKIGLLFDNFVDSLMGYYTLFIFSMILLKPNAENYTTESK